MGVAAAVGLFLLGLVLIIKGGDWFLEGAVWMAEASGIPRFLIGATVVSLVTTLPELTVSVMGVAEGQVDLAVANAVGSVTANLGLILGISALWRPAGVAHRQFDWKAAMMVTGALILTLLCRRGTLHLLPALTLGAVFGLYLVNNLADARGSVRETPGEAVTGQWSRKLLAFLVGVGAILLGSRLLIDYGSALAALCGVPASVIGVTMVAVGTSLPELVTAVTALAKGEAALTVGNILGANVIDLTLILPVCAAVSGGSLPIGRQTAALDLPFCLLLCLVSVVPPWMTGRFSRWQGGALLGLYGLYVAGLVL